MRELNGRDHRPAEAVAPPRKSTGSPLRTTYRIGGAAIAVTLLAAAIVNVRDEGEDSDQGYQGNVIVSGSSTVEPVSLILAEEFHFFNPNWTYSVEGPGTTTGFEQFCNRETDVSDASRRIKDSEVEQCGANGVEPIEIKVAVDGLAVITHPENEALQCLDLPALYAIFGPESDDIRTWPDAQAFAEELGSTTTSWPAGALAITAPGDESGTHDSFVEIAIEGLAEERGQDKRLRTPGDTYIASPNDNVIIDGVSGFPTSLGFIGYAFAVSNPDKVRMIGVDGSNGCILPDAQSVAEGNYPIARDLFIYPDANRIDPKSDVYNPALAPYVDFYLNDAASAELISFIGYVPLSEAALQESIATWDAAKPQTGTTSNGPDS